MDGRAEAEGRGRACGWEGSKLVPSRARSARVRDESKRRVTARDNPIKRSVLIQVKV